MNNEQGSAFWAGRQSKLVANYPIIEWRQASDTNERLRQQRQTNKREHFFEQQDLNHSHTHDYPFLTTTQHLTFWAMYSSWSYCNTCKMLIKNNIMPAFRNCHILKAKASCVCSNGRYIITKFDEIPIWTTCSKQVRILVAKTEKVTISTPKDLSTNCQSLVEDCRSTVDCLSTDCWPIVNFFPLADKCPNT